MEGFGQSFLMKIYLFRIIIYKSKDRTYVEYALKRSNVPIGVATYQLSSSLPEDMRELLPEPDEIVRRLRIFEKDKKSIKMRSQQ